MRWHSCDDAAVRSGARCLVCGAHRVYCATCGDDLTDHERYCPTDRPA